MKVPISYASPNFVYYWNLRNLPIKHLRQGWTTLYLFVHLNAIDINFSAHHLSTYVSYVNAQSAPPRKVERVMYGCNPSTQESKWKVIVSHRVSSSPSWAISKNKLGSEEMAKELRVLAAFLRRIRVWVHHLWSSSEPFVTPVTEDPVTPKTQTYIQATYPNI